jgi:hypothetical protein
VGAGGEVDQVKARETHWGEAGRLRVKEGSQRRRGKGK